MAPPLNDEAETLLVVEDDAIRKLEVRILSQVGHKVVDGKRLPDPLAKESAPNPFGERNSVLIIKVASSPEAAHLADAENLPLKDAHQQKT